jgi:hypothetical protein
MLNHLTKLDAFGWVLVQSQAGLSGHAGIADAASRMGKSQNSLKC